MRRSEPGSAVVGVALAMLMVAQGLWPVRRASRLGALRSALVR